MHTLNSLLLALCSPEPLLVRSGRPLPLLLCLPSSWQGGLQGAPCRRASVQTGTLLVSHIPSFPYEPLERTPALWQGMGNQRATDQILPCSSRRSLNLLSELLLVFCELLSCRSQVVRPPHIGPARWEFS